MGFKSAVARTTLAKANEVRNWRIYADIAQYLIKIARKLYQGEDLGLDIENSVCALDATTIDLCLALCPWALFRSTKSGIRLHTLLDLHGNIPSFLNITPANIHEVNMLDLLPMEPGAFYIMDRAYLDFARLHKFTNNLSFFVIRAKSNLQFSRVYSMPVDRQTGLICDQHIRLTGQNSARSYPAMLRRVKFNHPETGKRLVFLTNNFSLPALTITELYRLRWQVELFFQMDQTESQNQNLLRQQRECHQDSNMDGSMCVFVSCHRQKKSWHPNRTLHFFKRGQREYF